MTGRDIIVIGASAGGVEALATLVRTLPADLPAAVFIVLHVPASGTSVLPSILNRAGPLPAAHAVEGEAIEHGRIYVAPPDHHLMLRHGTVHLSRGPKENGTRPAVDPLMRTAARSYAHRVVAVVLSGNLDDGTAGLVAVRARGGLAIVQDPDEALFPGMPRSAVEHAAPDHVLALSQIPAMLAGLATTPVHLESRTMDPDTDAVDLNEAHTTGVPGDPLPGVSLDGEPPSPYTCPECHGSLWEVQERGLMRFQCRVGHRYSSETLVAEQAVALEAALWTALRTLEESIALARRLAERAVQRGHPLSVARFHKQVTDLSRRADVIRDALHDPSGPEAAPAATGANGDDIGKADEAGNGRTSATAGAEHGTTAGTTLT